MRVKDGAHHIASLHDDREVWLRGARVSDVTTHPAFRSAVASAAALYDFQAAPANLERMTIALPNESCRVNRAWQLPRSYTELVERRRALEVWAAVHYGFMGRSPDHVASTLAGMVMGIDVFRAHDPKRAAALLDYFDYARGNDLFLTYVIINPQADRSKTAHEQADEFLTLGVVDEDAAGITVRGAKMLATSGIMANEVFVASIQPLQKGDERYAVAFCVPMDAPGLKILSRKSYEESAPSRFDNPLANRFDENDAILYFADVKVPWERIFINQSIELSQRQWHATPAHVLQNYQAQIRLTVKMTFLLGVARKIAETNGTLAFPGVRETLGQLAAEAGLVEGLVYGMEAKGTAAGGYYVPDRHLLYSAQVLTQQLYGKVVTALRELAGGGMIMLPSGIEDFANPALRDLINKTQKSPAMAPEERVKLFKLAWDAVGSEFASRHTQYEMFYAGATFVTKGHAFRTYDWASATGMVDRLMAEYDLDAELAGRGDAAS
ncbi:MAG TPA: 4-hydroxyphenylacetate 3-hydroxylase N-terminal domain-containing protein [Stellaceae bacterium]|nr:4-hydroxyphenylacetate 3-hydroxylase N-terminal domain-containing protein [Stellaceae bacterium]